MRVRRHANRSSLQRQRIQRRRHLAQRLPRQLGHAGIVGQFHIVDVEGKGILPPIRRGAKRLGLFGFARWARKQNMSVVTTTYEGTTVTKVVPGDVVVGDVIRREDDTDSQGPTPDGNHPPIGPGGK